MLNYTAPEVTAPGATPASYTADAFSLGCILHDCFQLVHLVGVADVARPLLDLPDYATPGGWVRGWVLGLETVVSQICFVSHSSSYVERTRPPPHPGDQHQKIQNSYPWNLQLPPELRDLAERMLCEQAHLRPEAASLISLGYFHSGAVATLRDLDVLPSKVRRERGREGGGGGSGRVGAVRT